MVGSGGRAEEQNANRIPGSKGCARNIPGRNEDLSGKQDSRSFMVLPVQEPALISPRSSRTSSSGRGNLKTAWHLCCGMIIPGCF